MARKYGFDGQATTESSPTIDHRENEVVEEEEHQECQICWETKPASSFRLEKITPTCKHSLSICTDCLALDVGTQLKVREWQDLECTLCPIALPSNTIKEYVEPELFLEYQEYMATYRLSKMKLFSKCCHPGCKPGQIHPPGRRSPRMTCHKCGNVTCYSCEVPYHTGQSCKKFAQARLDAENELLPQEKRSARTIRATTNRCPGCNVPIERESGCVRMACVACGKRFDWTHPRTAEEPEVAERFSDVEMED